MAVPRNFLALLLVIATTVNAAPQLLPKQAGTRRFNEKPLWTMWTTGFSEHSVLNYASRIAGETGLRGRLSKQIKRELDSRKDKPKTSPIKGTMMFMVVGIPPGVETLEFQELKDKAEFEKFLERRKLEHWGEDKKIEGVGDLRSLVWSSRYTTRTMQGENGELQVVTEASPEPSRTRIYFRRHDGIVFEARFPELHDMDLPGRKELGMGRRRRDEDLYFHADLTVVPKGMKEIFHSILTAEANRFLQQRDTEQLAPYEFRKAASDVLMELLRAGTFDINEASGYIKFATDTRPVRARFDVKVRSGSSLSRQLAQVAKGRSRLPAEEDAVLTLRSTWSMPPALKKLLAKTGPYLMSVAEKESDPYAKAGLAYVARATEETGKRGQFESAVHFGGNESSGPVMYGALRVEEPTVLATGLEAMMLTGLLRSKGQNLPQISSEEHNGRKYVRVTARDLDWPIDMKPECLFLVPGDDAIWFAIGGENAWAILPDRLDGRNQPRAKAMLLDLKLSLDRFLADDDPAGLGEFGRKLDVQLDNLLPNPFPDGSSMNLEPQELLETVLSSPGRTLKLSIDPTPTGFAAAATVDEAIADYAVARLMSAQNRMMLAFEEQQKKRVKEMQERARQMKADAAKAKKAAKAKEKEKAKEKKASNKGS